jgi:FHS family L-fucose permease-like MFS transporter
MQRDLSKAGSAESGHGRVFPAGQGTLFMLRGTLVALAAGRTCSTPLMKFVAPARMAVAYALVNMALVAAAIARPGSMGGYALLVSSFSMSIMFPKIFALGVKGLGPNTKLGGSLIVMAVVGGAVIPPLMGLISHHTGSVAAGFWLPFAGYVVVALYGFFGSHVGVHEVQLSPEVL